jgi:hypothetical protein
MGTRVMTARQATDNAIPSSAGHNSQKKGHEVPRAWTAGSYDTRPNMSWASFRKTFSQADWAPEMEKFV